MIISVKLILDCLLNKELYEKVYGLSEINLFDFFIGFFTNFFPLSDIPVSSCMDSLLCVKLAIGLGNFSVINISFL